MKRVKVCESTPKALKTAKTLVIVFVQEFKTHAWLAKSEDLTPEMHEWLRAASENNYDCLDADVRGFMAHPDWDDDEDGDQFDEPEDRLSFVKGRKLAERVFAAEDRYVLEAGEGPVEVGPGEYIEYVYTITFCFY